MTTNAAPKVPSGLPDAMHAIAITKPGGPESLAVTTRPLPRPGPGEMLVRNRASSVNRLDVFQREGVYPVPPGVTDIPGLDVAGTVVEVGPGVARWSVGDEICALVPGGGYADYCVVAADCALPIPKGLSFAEAATLPETTFTVWSNVFDRAALKPGEMFLVHGGAGGIGITAIQMASRLGARVFTTAGSDERCRACEALGAELAINYKTQDYVAVLKQHLGGKGVDVVLDVVGGEYTAKNIDLLAIEGRLVQIALLTGAQVSFNYGLVMMKRLTLTGSTLRARPNEFKGAIARALEAKVWPLLEAGTFKPVISRSFPIRDIARAHEFIVSGENFGKIALDVEF